MVTSLGFESSATPGESESRPSSSGVGYRSSMYPCLPVVARADPPFPRYRLFGDLVAIGMRAGFRLPSLRPPPSTRLLPPGAPTPSLVPLNVLQHPGYYFYLAGTCAVERRERFRALVKSDAAQAAEKGGEPSPISPAVAHETKVDHAEIVIEVSRPRISCQARR